MITPYQKPEDKDSKANNFWTNLAGKLGLKAPIVRQASAAEQKGQRLSDGIQTHVAPVTRTPGSGAREASISRVSDDAKMAPALLDRYTGVFHRAVAELGQSERVKAADRLSRIEAEMAGFKDKLQSLGGDKSMADLVGEVSAKADSLTGACVQLRDKVEALSTAQAQSIENAFFVLSDARNEIDKIKADSGGMGEAMSMEMGAPMEDGQVGGDLPDEPRSNEGEVAGPSPIAGHVPAMMKAAADASYDSLRLIHTKFSLVESMLMALVSELSVGDMLGAPVAPGAPPEGMPPMEEMGGEQKEPTPPLALPEASLCARMGKFAGSGDPGDSEPGNLIYKSLDKCRDCVWFESDWTHETYRDKCKHCTHASLGGAIEHFWPRAQQMVMWIPSWTAPVAEERKVRLSNAFTGTLSMVQTAKKVSDAVLNIAADILDRCEHTAVDLGTGLVEYFQEPVIAKSMPILAQEVAAEIERSTGIEIAVSQSKAKAWGHKQGGLAEGEVTIACDPTLMHLAKGEKRQIKELREKLRGEKDPAKIKSLNEAIDSLYSRMDADKKRKEERRQQREEKSKKDQEAADKEPAKFPAPATASFAGTLCLAAQPYCDACDNVKSLCKCDPVTKVAYDPHAKDKPGAGQNAPRNFKVVAISSNANSFGLHGVIMISEDGEAWQAAASSINLPEKGSIIPLEGNDVAGALAKRGYEIPHRLPQPPADVVQQVWGKQASSAGRSL